MEKTKATVINLLGGPGCGKSTAAAGLFYTLKMNHHNAELVTEYARDLIYSDRQDMLHSQEYIFAKQNHRLHRLRKKVDWIITDSPLLLSTIYTRDFWRDDITQSFIPFVLKVVNTYNNFNVFLKRPSNYQTEDTGRIHDLKGAVELDERIVNMLEQYDIPYFTVETEKGAVQEIWDLIQSQMANEAV